jgi:hypothetical protein
MCVRKYSLADVPYQSIWKIRPLLFDWPVLKTICTVFEVLRVVFTQYASLLTDITNSSHTHSTDKNSQDGPVYFFSPHKSEIL